MIFATFIIAIMQAGTISPATTTTTTKTTTRTTTTTTTTTTTLQPTKFVIDTDAGVDDGQALAYAINTNREVINGITIVPGNADAVSGANNVLRILRLMNATNIPVYLGARRPMVNAFKRSTFFGNDSFGDVPEVEPRLRKGRDYLKVILRRGSAVRAIINRAYVHPNQITLVCLGPLTNLALAFLMEPKLPGLLKRVILLGGASNARGNVEATAEFNIFTDPEAAKLVIENFRPLILPLDVVKKYSVAWSEYDDMVNTSTPHAHFLRLIYAKAIEKMQNWGMPEYMFADEAAIALAMHPNLIGQTRWLPVTVELTGANTRGQLVIDYRPFSPQEPNAEVVMAFDGDTVYERYYHMFRDKV